MQFLCVCFIGFALMELVNRRTHLDVEDAGSLRASSQSPAYGLAEAFGYFEPLPRAVKKE